MILNNIKTRQKDSGFTIVELLVVIVVIGILAAITIVSYSGITSRASTQQNLSNANSVLSAVMVYYANVGSFPVSAAAAAANYTAINTATNDAKLPAGIDIRNGVAPSGSIITYRNQGTTGVCVGYYDFVAPAQARYLFGGTANADNGSACSGT